MIAFSSRSSYIFAVRLKLLYASEVARVQSIQRRKNATITHGRITSFRSAFERSISLCNNRIRNKIFYIRLCALCAVILCVFYFLADRLTQTIRSLLLVFYAMFLCSRDILTDKYKWSDQTIQPPAVLPKRVWIR